MSPPGVGLALVGQGFPRVSGDEPRVYTIEDAIETFSPRERG